MDPDMAPPPKRRKLSNSASLDMPDVHPGNSTGPSGSSHSFPQQAVVGGIEHFKVLIPRQGTTASSTTNAQSTIATSSDGATIMFSDPSTTITFTPPSLPTLPSILGATTFSSASTSAPSEYTSRTESSSPLSSLRSNTTSLSSSSFGSISSSGETVPSSSTTSVSSHSLTTSAIIFEGNGTTTSKTTITLTSPSSDVLFFATLSNGQVSTISRSSGPYTTTFDDGEVFTISGLSSTSESQTTTSSSSQTATFSNPSAERSTLTSTATVEASSNGGVAGQGYSSPTSSSPPNSTSADAASNDRNNDNSSTPPPGTIAGGVVGGCAGLAVLLLIAMLFVRWYRRKGLASHRALPPGSASGQEADPSGGPSGPGMAERAGLMPMINAVPALFRPQNRSIEPSETSERGFTRVSGRKLPSAFSEGMSSPPPPNVPLTTTTRGNDRDMAGQSFFRDSAGTYSGDGADVSPTSPASSRAPMRNSTHEMMMMSPGPQRQPQWHAGGPYGFPQGGNELSSSPPMGSAAFQRSDTPSSLDPSRNSRFTEEM